MKRLLSLVFIGCFFVSGFARAAQPISESMVECAVIFEIFSNTAEQKGKPQAQILKMRGAAQNFLDASYVQAEQEGETEFKAFIDNIFNEKMQSWHEKVYDSSTATFLSDMPEMIDWAKYCGKMGKHYGVLKK